MTATDPFLGAARETLDTRWAEVAEHFTLSWVGPMHLVLANYDDVAEGLKDVAKSIVPDAFGLTYETRQSEPQGYVMAVALREDPASGVCCRLLASAPLTDQAGALLTDFSIALWTLVESGELPRFDQAQDLEAALTARTSPYLFTLRQEEINPPEELLKTSPP